MSPLSYCFASFHPGDYDRYPEPIGRMWSLGLRFVTFVPTFVVREPFEIGLDYTPPLATIRAALTHALAIGMDVKLEPHLDWQSTLDGQGPWRGLMRFSPAGEYFGRVIAPMRDIAVEAKSLYPERHVSLTLGSEVDRSLVEFPSDWMQLQGNIAPHGIEVGHKLNHDAPAEVFRTAYLASLDYVSFSFYPTIAFARPREWWRSPQADEEIAPLSEAFERSLTELERKLPAGPEFQIGEFGLGSADVAHPYKLDPEFFGRMDAGRSQTRRKYYQAFLRAAGRRRVTFWSAGYFDILGVFSARFKDDWLASQISKHT